MTKISRTDPPKWIDRFLEWFCRPQELEILRGDLYELYGVRLKDKGKFLADFFFTLEVLDLFRPFAIKRFTKPNTGIMFKNYFKVSYRNFVRQRVYSLLNISGLVVGLTCFILIFFFIKDELSYDRFHSKSDRIYRVMEHFESEGVGEHSASLPFPTGPALENDFPEEIEHSVRFFNFQSPTMALANKANERAFNESRIFFADSSLLHVFDFELLEGNRETALDQPNSILITPSMAKKYFGNENPIGKSLEFQGQQNLQITGILEDAPLNAHFQYDFIISFSSLRQWFGGSYPNSWYWNPCWTYVVLDEDVTPKQFATLLPDFVNKYFPDFIREDVRMELQPLEDIHLYSALDYEIQANSDVKNIYIFGAIAIFVLIIAGINFINLNTARATNRAKEVGVRKAVGSKKSQLISQFIFESILITFFSVLLSIIIVMLVLPSFNALVEKSIGYDEFIKPYFMLGVLGLTLLVGILSGFYPAFVLSSFKAISIFKGGRVQNKGLNFRRVLVSSQFAISIFLIVATFVALDQFKLLQNKDLGFDQEHVLMVPVIRSPIGGHYEEFRELALKSPYIKSMTGVEEIIGAKHQVENYRFEGMERSKPFPRFELLHDFTQTMNIEMAAGRDYSREHVSDDSLALVINEAMVKAMGWSSAQEAINKRFYRRGELRGEIIGVVKDYNFVSKHHPIGPIVLDLNTDPRAFNLFIKYLAVRIEPQHVEESMNALQEAWFTVLPDRPFDAFFLDDRLNESYKSEQKLTRITLIFSILAILVACLGLFGLATFSVESRTKEIGIRKVLGIKVSQIFALLSRQFIYLILIAFAISIPVSWLLLDGWLNGFAYRVSLEIWPFVIAGVITFAVAMITILYHVFKAYRINPVRALKHE